MIVSTMEEVLKMKLEEYCGTSGASTRIPSEGNCKVFWSIGTIQINFHMKTCKTGLHNSFHSTIRDGSTCSKFGARGEHLLMFK